jgi:galacturonosyltransferase
MGRVLVLINSSGGLFDFRNEFVEALLKDHQVFVSVPDDVKTKERQEQWI